MFDTLSRTTRTVIADTNLTINIDALFDVLPIVDYTEPEKRKGRRKSVTAPPVLPAPGSIVLAKLGTRTRGSDPKKGKMAFKNSITIVMAVRDRMVNFKLSKNGRFQITGNNDDYHVEKCVKHMWKLLSRFPDLFSVDGTSVKVTFWSSMENFKTSLGFRLDRQKLNTLVNEQTEYVSVFETSSGSASVNIKMPLGTIDILLNTMTFRSNKWVRGTVSYADFVARATGKITRSDTRFVSFLVFHTGEVIVTAMCHGVMRPYVDAFAAMMAANRNIIM